MGQIGSQGRFFMCWKATRCPFRRYPKISELLMMIAAGFAENLGYRQLNMWWRAKGCLDYLKGSTA